MKYLQKRFFDVKRVLAVAVLCLYSILGGFAQIDTVFWFAAPDLEINHQQTPVQFCFTTYNSAATITVEQPTNSAFPTATFTVPADSFYVLDVSNWVEDIESKPANTVLNRGFRISATDFISCYYESVGNNSEMYTLKGSSGLGTDFLVPMQVAFNSNYTSSTSSIEIIATEDNTVIQITAPVALQGGIAAGSTVTVTLQRGQTYVVRAAGTSATDHLHNTVIHSNKPIVVNSTDDSVASGWGCVDLIGDQLVPINMTGRRYVAIRNYSSYENAFERVFVFPLQNNTTVWFNGVPQTVSQGSFIDHLLTDTATLITSNNPIIAFQITATGCEQGGTMLPHLECTGSYSVSHLRPNIASMIVTLVTGTIHTGNFTLNGNPNAITAADFHLLAADPTLSYCLKDISNIVPTGTVMKLTNSSGRFQLGILDGDNGGSCSYGFFSDYARSSYVQFEMDSLYCVGDSIVFHYSAPNVDNLVLTGPNSLQLTTPPFALANANTSMSGWYYLEGADTSSCYTVLSDSIYIQVVPVSEDTTHLIVETCDSYTWHGTTYTQTGNYTYATATSGGCVGIEMLHLTILPPPVILHTPDTTIQAGDSATLWASGTDVLYWTDANGNILASGPTLTVNPTISTMYYITGQNMGADLSNNLVVNGDFEQGNVNFYSELPYYPPCYNCLTWGSYSITTDEILLWGTTHFYGYGGIGNFMMVDGSTTPNAILWQQTVPVTPNTYYAFSAQVASIHESHLQNSWALLQFSVNGIQLGPIFHSPNVQDTWLPYYEVWYSGNNTSATLTILNQNNNGYGNDFGLDNIVFAPVSTCTAYDSVLVAMATQLSATATATDNTDCIGRNCFYNGPTILINEVMLAPSTYDGSIAGSSGCGEWIELYNPHKCDSVDISCYFLGNNAPDYANYGGGFVIPPGSVVPPQGFALVRGVQAPPPNDSLLVQNGGNVVDIVVTSRYCVGGGSRLWFPNAGGWFAFYDANGVPQDAISWYNQSNSCMSCNPCNPGMSDCGFQGTLPSYSDIPATHKNYITSFDPESAGCLGKSFRRIPDGGAWQDTPSVPTYGTCNDVCVEPAETSCNAIAVVTAIGGIPPYTYQWDDNAGQTTDTAFALCAGTYTVTVTDALLNTAIAQVTVVDYQPVVTHPSSTYCLSDSSAILSGFPSGGTYEGCDLDGNTLHFHDSAAVYSLTYTFADSNGCASTADFTVTVNPSYQVLIYDTICQRAPYDLHGFHLTPQQTDIVGLLQVDSVYQTTNNCDSAIRLSLFVLPSEIITCDTALCKGDFFEGYGLTLMSDTMTPGSYQYANVYQNQYGCDSMVTVNLTIHPVYDIRLDVDICQGENYNQYGFQFNTDTMQVGTHEMVHEEVTSMGCDSVFLLNVNLLPSSQTFFSDTICQYTAYSGYGFTLSENETATSGLNTFDHILTNQFGCDSIIRLNLYVKPVITPEFYANPDRAMLSENPVIYFVNNTNIVELAQANYYWVWDFGDGTSDTTSEAENSHLYTNWGDYTVTLTLWADGCIDSASVSVFIEADLEFPNVITPNGDGINDVFVIKNLNPDRPNRLYITDRWGKTVWNQKNYQTYMKDEQIYNAESGFGMGNISDGVYYYTFYYEGMVRTVKFNGSITVIR